MLANATNAVYDGDHIKDIIMSNCWFLANSKAKKHPGLVGDLKIIYEKLAKI